MLIGADNLAILCMRCHSLPHEKRALRGRLLLTEQEHNPFCEGEVSCSVTGRDECGKEMIFTSDGVVASVYCFGCNKIHNVARAHDPR